MVAWVVIYRQHPRRTLPYTPAPIPILGLTPPSSQKEIAPFFSCTYVERILQPLCFQIHAWNGGVYTPLQQKRDNSWTPQPLAPASSPTLSQPGRKPILLAVPISIPTASAAVSPSSTPARIFVSAIPP